MYYLPTTIGRGAVDEQLTHGEHVGDLGESPLHRVITYLTGVYYQEEGYNTRVYVNADELEDYESDSDEAKPDVFDVKAEAGLNTDDEIVEVELEETIGNTRHLRPREMVRNWRNFPNNQDCQRGCLNDGKHEMHSLSCLPTSPSSMRLNNTSKMAELKQP